MNSGAVSLGRVRIRGAGADTTALRLRTARELQAADLSPAGLPPAAVLVVRRLGDPLPGQFGSGRARPRARWEAAVRHALQASARRAARPDRGRIDPAADAVIFADEAEIVACLIADMTRGEVSAHWWWRSVLPRLELSAAIARAGLRDPVTVLRERVREAPAALALLSARGEASRVAAAISPAGAAVVLGAMAREYGLAAELIAPSPAPTPPALRPVWPPSVAVLAPWAGALPPGIAAPHVAPVLHCLFGVALTLHATPWRLRSADAVAQATRWWAHVLRTPIDAGSRPAQLKAGPAASAGTTLERRVRDQSKQAHDAFDRVAALGGEIEPVNAAASGSRPRQSAPPWADGHRHVSAGEPPALVAPPAPLDRPSSDVPAVTPLPLNELRAAPGSMIDTVAPPAESGTAPTPPRLEAPRDERDAHAPRREPAPSIAPADAAAPAEWPGECVVTRVGGLLYLIHALQNLGVPDAFEARWALASQAGPWGALDLIGRALLGRRLAAVADDPLWPALARLAAWPPARRSGPDPAFHIPSGWLPLLDDRGERFNWTAREGRLWIWSAAGYLVAHRAWRGARPPDAAAVRRELARAGLPATAGTVRRRDAAAPWLPSSALPAGCPARYGRLAAAIAPAVRRRLLLALGLGDQRSRRDHVAELLQVRARLYLSSSHIDLVASLDRADLATRRAGLDRDPGWLPGYGRVIYFHFS